MTKAANPSCPRCGYDQSGVIASWVESCPLQGTCSECGLEFAWYDVILANRLRVPGFFEHMSGLQPRAAWRTWVWTLWPAKFWRRVRLEHPVRLSRAWLWLLLLLVQFQLAHIAFDGWESWKKHVAVSLLAKPPAGVPVQVAPAWTKGLLARWLDPLLGSPEINYLYVKGTPPPRSQSLSAVIDDILAWWSPGWRDLPQYAMPILCFSLALPVMLLFLPDTRKVSKIRRVHVARAFVYSQSWLVALAGVRFLDQVWVVTLEIVAPTGVARGMGWPYRSPVLLPILRYYYPMWVCALVCIWLTAWWWFAVSRGFRVQRAATVFTAMLLPALLALTIAALLVSSVFGTFVDNLLLSRFWPR